MNTFVTNQLATRYDLDDFITYTPKQPRNTGVSN